MSGGCWGQSDKVSFHAESKSKNLALSWSTLHKVAGVSFFVRFKECKEHSRTFTLLLK